MNRHNAQMPLSFGTEIALYFGQSMFESIDGSNRTTDTAQGDDSMQALATTLAPTPVTSPTPTRITTTLYDLVEAVSAEVGPDEEQLVAATIMHLINANRARFVGSRKTLKVVEA